MVLIFMIKKYAKYYFSDNLTKSIILHICYGNLSFAIFHAFVNCYRSGNTGPMQTFSEKAKMDNEVSKNLNFKNILYL